MLISIIGTDSFLAREAITRIKVKYLEKNPDGTELVEIDCDLAGSADLSFDRLRTNFTNLQAVPLFATSRLVVIRGAGLLSVSDQDGLAAFLDNLPSTTVAVVWDQKALKPNSVLSVQTDNAAKLISANPLEGQALRRWIGAKAKELEIELGGKQTDELIQRFGSDLWAISTELETFSLTGRPTSSWAKGEVGEAFALFRLVRQNNWTGVAKELRAAMGRKEAPEMLLGSLAAAVRRDVRQDNLKLKLTELMADVDIAMKTGTLEPDKAISVLAAHIANPDESRVQWEATWEEIRS
ncbi:hypothetical protein A3A71_00375 [Candidatus Berkelbacteria bacterium RIFCSPLOWO2_01_FULL_50_28]|uniref:Uncharacterized protein n=1 Tax=Candidatus Berkelbacteria bacterium RIFCSPLOWO2_01_FULL_50_28 TaxID=1797471 RepID=A0A1F5EAV5_9BACT|nr:MAG: hypothetical protein A2807_01130 [Candidatus Berkelbacteria bacterium RIFCSPHIGHO2_01_FULL_50_36]OGD63555.1 MAG: hypothetical protein A3F39_02525 [Candidatus Berkelbacteria bacterium RIFCSPHIGHO2_12_FULL_50_11]OGD64503.1 MAG: hypothetical protein A3A71_00375 [Candidatus Berkelbacteria bacterium RIFCSPLOWO2_01_FULL_50_28]